MSGVSKAAGVGLVAIGLLLLGLLILVFTIDLGRFKPLIVGFASDYLERQIDIDGPLSIGIGRKVQVSGQTVRVASEDWTEVPEIVSVERFAITMDTWSLLKGIALFDDVQAGGIRAHLEVDADGRDNWTFAGLEDDDDEEATPVVIRQAVIADAQISYTSPDLPPILLVSSRLDLHERPDRSLDVALQGAVNEAPLAASGNLGTVDSLIEGRDVPFQITGEVGEITVAGSGLIDDLYEPRRPRVELSVQGPNAEHLTDILEIDPVTTGAFSLQASMTDAEGRLSVDVEGTYGEFNLDLNGQVADLQSLDDLDLSLHTDGPSIATIGRLAGQSGFPEEPFSVDARLTLRGTALDIEQFLFDLGAATVEATASLPNFPGLDGAQANLVAAGPQFGDFNRLMGLPGQLTGPFEAVLTLERTEAGSALDTRLEANALQASAAGTLTDHPELVGSTLKVALGGDDASLIAAALGADGVPAKSFAASADLVVGDDAIEIGNGVASLGAEEVEITGSIGRDPFSQATRLRFETEVADLKQMLTAFDLPAENVPAGTLTLTAELGRVDEAFLIDPLVASLGEIDARINARIGDSLELSDMSLNFGVNGRNLAELLPLEETYLSNEAFRVTGRMAFSSEDTIEVQDLEVDYGPAGARAALSLSLLDPLAAGEARFEAQSPSVTALVPAAAEYLTEDSAFNARGGGRWRDGSLWLEDTTIRVGEARLDLSGELHAPPEIAGTAMTLRASLPSLRLLELVADQTLPDDPLTVTADVFAEADVLRVSALKATLGKSDLAGTAAFRPASDPASVPELTAELESRLLDLRPLQAVLAEAPAEEAPPPEDGRLIPDTALPLAQLRSLNGAVRVNVARISFEKADLTDVLLAANLTDGALLIERFELGGEAGGKLGGTLRLTPSADGAELDLALDGANLIVGLPADSEEARQLLPRYELSTRLAATGATLRELAATSRGYLRLVAGEGQIELGAVTLLTQDFVGEVFNAINPFAKQERYSRVKCLAVLVEANDGVLKGKPAVVLQTDKLNVVGVGRVNLASEKLSAKFSTQARKGLGIGVSDLVSPLTEVGGTLASPRLQLNATGTLVEGGAAVATVGISFLAKKVTDRWFADKHPCRTAIADADKDLAEGGVPLSEPER